MVALSCRPTFPGQEAQQAPPVQLALVEQPAPAAVPLAHPVPQVRRERVGLLVHLESELQAPQGLPVDRLELRVLQVPRVRLDSKDRKVH